MTWTGSPAMAAVQAGSVAVSVFPSPVSISAIIPFRMIQPPRICESKWRMPTARPATSRISAKLWATAGTLNPSRRSTSRSSAAAFLTPASLSFSASFANCRTASTIAGSSALRACSRRATGATSRSAMRSTIPGRSNACSG